jgi:hypothetical protein
MAIEYTRWPIKYTNIYHSKALQNLSKFEFWFENIPSGTPAAVGDKRQLCAKVTRWVRVKFAQNVAQPIFSVNAKLLTWKNVSQMFWLFLRFQKTAQSQHAPNRRNTAQSGHPALRSL